MPKHILSHRRKRGLSQAKAKKIAREGLSSAEGGFHSARQERFIRFVAGGGKPTRMRSKRAKRRKA